MISPETQLAKFIRAYRSERGHSQGDFQKALDRHLGREPLPKNYVSLVERGARARLLDRFLAALEKETGKARTELDEMNRLSVVVGASSPTADDALLDIVTGHTAWASALIAAALSPAGDDGPNFKLATCAKRGQSDGEGARPELTESSVNWIEAGTVPRRDLAAIEKLVSPGDTYFFTAPDALEALADGWADLIAVPHVLKGPPDEHVRVGRLVLSASACVMICKATFAKRLLEPRIWENVASEWPKVNGIWDITARELAEQLRGEGGQVRIGAESMTIAQYQIAELCRPFGGLGGINPDDVFVQIDMNKAASTTLSSIDDLRDIGESKSLDAVLMWMPHAAWVLNALAKNGAQDQAHAIVALGHCPGAGNYSVPIFEFDLITTPTKSKDKRVMASVRTVLARAAKASDQISSFLSGTPGLLMHQLAVYFGVATQSSLRSRPNESLRKVHQVVGPVGYDVSIPPDSLDLFL